MVFTIENLERFLIAVDSELTSQHTIIMIGGAAATLHYQTKNGTVDIDTFNSVEALITTCERVRAKNPDLQIPLNASAPAQGPSKMDTRYETYNTISLSRLKILVPEKHDWILLKTARCDQKDLLDIKELANKYVINPDILKIYFKEEMLPYNPGNNEDLICRYLYMISIIFGILTAEYHQKFISTT